MEKDFFDLTTKIVQVQVFLIAEDYSEKSYKLIIPIERRNYKSEKFMFLPKSKVTDVKPDSIVLPKKLWENDINVILDKEVEFYNSKYDEKITKADCIINIDILEL